MENLDREKVLGEEASQLVRESDDSFISKYEHHANNVLGPNRINSPLDNANALSRLSVWWMNPLLARGYATPLQDEHLWDPPKSQKTENCGVQFDKLWDAETQGPKSNFALHKIFYRFDATTWLLSGAAYILFMGTQLLMPYFVQAIIVLVSAEDPDTSFLLRAMNGYSVAALMFVVQLTGVLSSSYVFAILMELAVKLRCTLQDKIFRKSMAMSEGAKQSSSSGQTLTLMSVDVGRLYFPTQYIHCIWGGTLIILGGVALLISYIGPAALSGVAMMGVMFYAQGALGNFIGKLRAKTVQQTQERVKLINEALRSIRVVKFYAWEDPIIEKIREVRRKEMKAIRHSGYAAAAFSFFSILSPGLVLGATLFTYAATGEELTVSKVFTTMAFISIIQVQIADVPMLALHLVRAQVSAKRIINYLRGEEIAPSSKNTKSLLPRGSISVVDGAFKWKRKELVIDEEPKPKTQRSLFRRKKLANELSEALGAEDEGKNRDSNEFSYALQNINLFVQPGSLCAVVGTVGSGKSTLVSALLGQLFQVSGSMDVAGVTAYVSQQPWIPHGTLRDTILFGLPYNRKKYDEVLRVTELLHDLSVRPSGDSTEIGEKGINLSGGQKARVALARALYRSESDVVVLDDPLSAVDAHVAQSIFSKAIMGSLASKTRLLVLTSHYQFLEQADLVVVMERGGIAAVGPPSELRSQFPQFFNASRDVLDVKREQTSAQGEESKGHLNSESGVIYMDPPENKLVPDKAKGDKDDETTGNGKLIDEEDREIGTVRWSTYLRFLNEIGHCGYFLFGVIIGLMMVIEASVVIDKWWLGVWGARGYDLQQSLYIGIYVAIIVFTGAATAAKAGVSVGVFTTITFRTHMKALERVLRAPVNTFFDVTPIGRVVNRFSQDIDQVDGIEGTFSDFAMMLLSVIAGISIACTVQPYIVFTFIPICLGFGWLQHYFRRSSREMKRLESISRTPVYSFFGEMLTGVSTIRAFNMQSQIIARSRSFINANTRWLFVYNMSSMWLSFRLDVLTTLLAFMVSLFAVAFRENVDPIFAGLAVNACLSLTGVFAVTFRVFVMLENSMTSTERVLFLESLETEAPASIPEVDPPASWPATGKVIFKDVHLRYRRDLPLVLKGFNLAIAPGEKLGLCGRTGAGKSSVMLALFRLVEIEEGSIFVDDMDISKIGLKALRKRIAIIPQDPVMFSGSIRYNLDPFSQFRDEEVWSALQRVQLLQTISDNPQKLMADVAEGGENWSVGERQLLCIARALLTNTRILVMDEATASVDSDTDRLIQETIQSNFSDRTIICVAHRLDTIIRNDRIAVVDDGRVTEVGSPAMLLRNESSHFSALAQSLGDDVYAKLKALSAGGKSR